MRRLALKREALTELATNELVLVAAAGAAAAAAHTFPQVQCVTQAVTDVVTESVSAICGAYNPTLLLDCPSSPCTR